MRKASKVLFRISGILSIVFAVSMLISCVIFFVLSAPFAKDALADMVKGTKMTVEQLQSVFQTLGITFIFCGLACIANAIICFNAARKDSIGLYIVSIVFGAISGVELNILASIFGLIGHKR